MSNAERHGVVLLAALDVRPRPDHKSELVTQLLMGETVRILRNTPRGSWLRVRNDSDGYSGWVRAWGIRPVSRERALRWAARARGRIVVPFCEVRSAQKGGHSLTPLFWNCRVIAGGARGGLRKIELPDGRRGWIPGSAITTSGRRPPMLQRIRALLGTPYLWGGRTPLGFDCSGFAQQVLAEQGFPIPRDAHQQFTHTWKRLNGREPRQGDLVFFGPRRGRVEHVGIVLGGGYFAHSRGWVRVNSIDPNNPFYDKALARMLRGFGRPPRGPVSRPRTGPQDPESA